MTPRGWTLLLLAVPVLYVLTLPPIALKSMYATYPGGVYDIEYPRWMRTYAVPFERLSDSGVLGDLLTDYCMWWKERIEPPRDLRPPPDPFS